MSSADHQRAERDFVERSLATNLARGSRPERSKPLTPEPLRLCELLARF
jgi:hypothetical protein